MSDELLREGAVAALREVMLTQDGYTVDENIERVLAALKPRHMPRLSGGSGTFRERSTP